MIGDPAYDPWPLIEQTQHHTLTERFAIAADILGESRQRLQAWALARTVEAALWQLSQSNDGTPEIATARELAELLD